MSPTNRLPYTSEQVLGFILLPKDASPLSPNAESQLKTFFDSYIKHNLTAAEREMVNGDHCWLAQANPDDFTPDQVIELHAFTNPETQNPKTITCVVDGCVQHTEGAVLSYRHSGEDTIHYLPRKKWGLYLFKIIADN